MKPLLETICLSLEIKEINNQMVCILQHHGKTVVFCSSTGRPVLTYLEELFEHYKILISEKFSSGK